MCCTDFHNWQYKLSRVDCRVSVILCAFAQSAVQSNLSIPETFWERCAHHTARHNCQYKCHKWIAVRFWFPSPDAAPCSWIRYFDSTRLFVHISSQLSIPVRQKCDRWIAVRLWFLCLPATSCCCTLHLNQINPFHLRKVCITARHNRQYSSRGGGERCNEVHQQKIWSLINGAVHPPLDFNAESLIRNWQLRWRHCPNPSAWIFQNHGLNSSAGPGGNNVSWLLCTVRLKSTASHWNGFSIPFKLNRSTFVFLHPEMACQHTLPQGGFVTAVKSVNLNPPIPTRTQEVLWLKTSWDYNISKDKCQPNESELNT